MEAGFFGTHDSQKLLSRARSAVSARQSELVLLLARILGWQPSTQCPLPVDEICWQAIVRNKHVCETRLASLRTGDLRASKLLQHETHCMFAAN